MIPFFPAPYPDELWYSVICRYHIRSGNPSVKYSIRELYGTNHINVPVELCGALSPLLEAIPTKALTAKDIIMQHTLPLLYPLLFHQPQKKCLYAGVERQSPCRAAYRHLPEQQHGRAAAALLPRML